MGVRSALTLVEVALSMALVAVAVLSLFLVIPQGFRAQRLVRYQALAAAKAMELVDRLHVNAPGVLHNARDLDKEGIHPWDSTVTYKAMAPDLEPALESLSSVVKPLPEGIGYRLDSDGDEIRKLLDAGGRLYYYYPSDPSGVTDIDPDEADERNWFDLTNSLIVGVVGAPQQNSILYHPSTKLGPYQEFFPTPPTHGRQKLTENVDSNVTTAGEHRLRSGLFVYDALRDPRIASVWLSDDASGSFDSDAHYLDDDPAVRYGAWPFLKIAPSGEGGGNGLKAFGLASQPPPLTAVKKRLKYRSRAAGYLIAALWYAQEVGVDALHLASLAAPPATDVHAPPGVDYTTNFDDFVEEFSRADQWRAVLAMRYVAHAGMCFSACFPRGTDLASADGVTFGSHGAASGLPVDSEYEPDDGSGSPTITYSFKGVDWTEETVNLDRIRAWHEASLRLAVRHAERAGPYHWGAPRPLNRQVMMDHPLVQLDIWSPPVDDVFDWVGGSSLSYWRGPRGYTFAGTDTIPPYIENGRERRRQWVALYPQAIQAPGRPFMYPGRVLDTDADGELDLADLNVPLSTGGTSAAVGDSRHFNLSHPFTPAERARELVFWAVDWQSYEDFESHPSAAIDASRYPVVAPYPTTAPSDAVIAAQYDGYIGAIADDPIPDQAQGWARWEHWRRLWDPMPASGAWSRRTAHERQLTVYRTVSPMPHSIRNPEHMAAFELPSRDWNASAGAFNGAFVSAARPLVSEVGSYGSEKTAFGEFRRRENVWGNANDDRRGFHRSPDISSFAQVAPGPSAAATALFGHPDGYLIWNKLINLGLYGANRNGVVSERRVQLEPLYGLSVHPALRKDLAVVDRGTVPPSVRLRATSVVRYVFYDPRISGGHFQ